MTMSAPPPASAPDENEKELLIEFRNKILDILITEEHKSDAFLIRWLRARDLDLMKAEDMIRKSFKWREEFQIDKLLNKEFDSFFPLNYPIWFNTKDKEGRPVLEIPIGSWDIRKAMDGGEKEIEFLNYTNQCFEKMMKTIRDSNLGRDETEFPNTQTSIIMDWQGYSYSQLIHWKALQSTLKLASTYETHYPETMIRIYFINCPSIFPLFMAMLKPIIAPNTLKKITCSSNPDEWKPLLLENIQESELPIIYGGSKKILKLQDGTEFKPK